VKLELDGAKDQFLHRASFACSFTFELTIEGIRNVDGGSHKNILPYLWLTVKDPKEYRENRKAGGICLRLAEI
jgi:hypothetical protein